MICALGRNRTYDHLLKRELLYQLSYGGVAACKKPPLQVHSKVSYFMAKINKINPKNESVLILPDIRSAINVGALFRTADAVGVSKIYLTGYTPRPTDRFDRLQKDIAKSALGAETWVPWEYQDAVVPLIRALKRERFTIIAIEQDERAVDYRTLAVPEKVAIILGPEVTGLDSEILDECDSIAFIPMHGTKESLNVSVAGGVALFRMLRP
jgi:23S rRNA (guanosine2251-2'-O)-methyltransferase